MGPTPLVKPQLHTLHQVRNSASEQSAKAISISGTVEAGGSDSTIASSAMAKTALTAGGAENNLTPMEVVVPAFEVYKVGQSMPLVSASNTITVTIQGTVDFPGTSTIMVSGLAGTQTAAVAALVVGGAASSLFGSAGAWSGSGTLILTLASEGGLSAGTPYTLSFTLQNSATAQAAVTVSVSGSVVSGGVDDSPVAAMNMDPDAGALLGVTNGASPLLTAAAFFLTKSVSHSSSLAGGSNEITLTLEADALLPIGSIITVTGLTDSQTVDGSLPVTSSIDSIFASDQGTWEQTPGTLELVLVAELAPATPVLVSFWVLPFPSPPPCPPFPLAPALSSSLPHSLNS